MSLSKDQVSESEAGPNDEEHQGLWTTKDALDRYRSCGYTYPFAVVIWWTACIAAVACPYCQRVHTHGCVLPNRHDLTSRASHCGNRAAQFLEYTILFPFSEHPEAARLNLCFEIDKINKRFKTIGVDAEETIKDSIDDLENAFRVSAIADNEDKDDEDGEDEVKSGETNERVKFTKKMNQRSIFLEDDKDAIDFASFCVSNKLRRAQSVYEQSSHQYKLLNEKNRAGDTVLSMTAMDGHDEVVSFLLEKGAKADTINARGRTPLMEAALWGRSLVVRRLLSAAASVKGKDHKGLTALDLAQDSRQNEEERASRSDLYSDDLDKRQQRRIIVTLLGGTLSLPHKVSRIKTDNAESARLYRSGVAGIWSRYTLLTSTVEIPVENFHKTVAFLNRGRSFPVVFAKSGWSTAMEGLDYLNNSDWTQEVFEVCATIGYDLPPHMDDGTKPGRFYACHAEKQLMAFFLHKHCFSPRDVNEDEELANLAEVHSDRRLRNVTIMVSTTMCEDCKAFRAVLQQLAEVSIDVRYLPTVT
ncbi:hypothetical protein MMC17_010258 [Xylographa soralifera]|nr:hypothetical protein [Xylographa soralifera]